LIITQPRILDPVVAAASKWLQQQRAVDPFVVAEKQKSRSEMQTSQVSTTKVLHRLEDVRSHFTLNY